MNRKSAKIIQKIDEKFYSDRFTAILFLFFGSIIFADSPVADQRPELDLRHFERTIYSQNGEDGIIEKIFDVIGTNEKYFVEFGGYDGLAMSNTRKLREFSDWTGLMLDGTFENLSINLRKEFITAENINSLFEKYQVPYDLDLLSIDIDYNDFHVWKAINENYRPRLIVIEYNASHLPHEDKVAVYYPTAQWDLTNYYGASILAMYNLGRQKGYSLVYAEKKGVNLFFIRDDLIEQAPVQFKNINDVKRIYRFPKYGLGPNGGHSQDLHNRPYCSSASLLDLPSSE